MLHNKAIFKRRIQTTYQNQTIEWERKTRLAQWSNAVDVTCEASQDGDKKHKGWLIIKINVAEHKKEQCDKGKRNTEWNHLKHY